MSEQIQCHMHTEIRDSGDVINFVIAKHSSIHLFKLSPSERWEKRYLIVSLAKASYGIESAELCCSFSR